MNELSLSELATRSKAYHARGLPQDARAFTRTYHLRFALPAATLVLSLVALGICGVLRSRVRRVVLVAVAPGLYWAMLALGERYTSLPAAVTVWSPNILFATMSWTLFRLRPSGLRPVLRSQDP